jgi:hypothetical protein
MKSSKIKYIPFGAVLRWKGLIKCYMRLPLPYAKSAFCLRSENLQVLFKGQSTWLKPIRKSIIVTDS